MKSINWKRWGCVALGGAVYGLFKAVPILSPFAEFVSGALVGVACPTPGTKPQAK